MYRRQRKNCYHHRMRVIEFFPYIHHDFSFFLQSSKILKNGLNVNAHEWKPNTRRTSVGNTSLKDIPMLDMFLQRLGDRHPYSDPSVPCESSVPSASDPVTPGNEKESRAQSNITCHAPFSTITPPPYPLHHHLFLLLQL